MARWFKSFGILAVLLGLPVYAQTQTKPAEPKEEDPGRPVLKRGSPSTKREEVKPPAATPTTSSSPKPQPAEDSEPAAPAAAPSKSVREETVDENGRPVRESIEKEETRQFSPSGDKLIDRAQEAAFEFDQGLPNFVCDQITSRYWSETMKPDWRYKDRVDVQLVYMNGREDYRNVKINGKAIKKGSPEDSGTWSSGEFGTMLMDLFNPATRAKFRLRGSSEAAGMSAKVYDFNVLKENSHWLVRFGGSVKPAYKGAIWVDPNSARVLRIEMNTRQLPQDFQIDTVESVVDYGWIMLSGKRFLLPLKSENLACFRGTFNCSRNVIEFRNYRKFEVESDILQVESDIVYPGEEETKKPDPKKKTQPPSIKQ